MEIDKIVDEISKRWSPLNDNQLNAIRSNIEIGEYKKNAFIFKEFEQPLHIMFLLSGKVKIYKEGVGHNQIVRVIKPIEMFGFRPYFSGEAHRTSATALEKSVIARLPLEFVEQLLEENNAVAKSIIRHLAIELGKADQRTISLTQKHIRGRLAEALIFLKDSYGVEEDECTLSIYLSREDMANLSNMTTSNAIRTLSAFATEKLIAIDGRKIKIIQEEKLRKISKMG